MCRYFLLLFPLIWLAAPAVGAAQDGATGAPGPTPAPAPVSDSTPPVPATTNATVAAPTPAEQDPAPAITSPTRSWLSPLAEQPRWKELESYSGVLSRKQFEEAFNQVYSDGSNFPLPWRVERDALVVETSPGVAPVRIAFREEYQEPKPVTRYWRTPAELSPLQPGDQPLKGLNIAIDPGHIGGGYAHMEERWLSMQQGEAVMEGQITLQVAQLLKPRLEALGAQVALVRSQEAPVSKAKPSDFKEQARQALTDAGILNPTETYQDRSADARILSVQWQEEKFFVRFSEIRARAELVNNQLKPDLVLCLHLNAEPWGDPAKPAFVPKNHFHLLINGCYSRDEIRHEDVRFELLRRIFTQIDAQEISLADPMAQAMVDVTHLPPYVYPGKNARRVTPSPYVYARNLLANRLYDCPVLYYEPYVMNHEETYKRLLLGHYIGRTLLDGRLVTSIQEEYLRSIVRGLRDYYTKARTVKPD